MTNYTIEQLQGMKLDEIKRIAKNEKGLTLSYQGKKFNKSELINNIIAEQKHLVYTEVYNHADHANMRPHKIYAKSGISPSGKTKTSFAEPFYKTLDISKVDSISTQVTTLLKDAKSKEQLKTNIQAVKGTINLLIQKRNAERKNILQKNKMSAKINQLKAIVANYERKL